MGHVHAATYNRKGSFPRNFSRYYSISNWASCAYANRLKWVMQDRFCLRHLSGSRADRVDRLVLSPEREITLGRDRECHVRYSEADELVSRKHLKIIASRETPVLGGG